MNKKILGVLALITIFMFMYQKSQVVPVHRVSHNGKQKSKSEPTRTTASVEVKREENNKRPTIDYSENAKLWAEEMPVPAGLEEKIFLDILAYVHDSDQELDPAEIDQLSAPFLHLDGSFDSYLMSVLDRLPVETSQRERNFIYLFAKAGRPDSSFSSYVLGDFHYIYGSKVQIRATEENQLTEILFSQKDLDFETKNFMLDLYGIKGPQ